MNQRFLRVTAALAAATLAGLPILSGLSASGSPPPVIHASRLAGVAGAGISGMMIQNMDASQSATVVVDLYKQSGGAPVSITRPNVGAGAAANVYLPSEPTLQNGAYAAITSSDRAIRTITRTDWNTSGGAAMSNDSAPSTELVVPFAMKDFEGQTSLVSIQNTDATAMATSNIELYPLGAANPLVVTTVAIGPGTSTTLNLSRNAAFATVPNGTAGHLRIRSTTQLAVVNLVDVETSAMAVFAHEGLPVELAQSRLFAPVVHAAAPLNPLDAASPALDTLMMVVNPGTSAISVSIHYTGVGGTCQGQTFDHASFALAGGASALVAQAPGAAYPPVAASPLPAGCNAAAVIETTGGNVLASVVDRRGAAGIVAAAYNALAAAEGGTIVRLPLARKNHTAGRVTTAMQVMNLGASPASVTLTWRDSMGVPVTGCGADCSAAIPVDGAHLFWPPSIAAIPDGTYGSAEVTSDQPAGVVVSDISVAGASDIASYVGLAEAGGGGPMPGPTPAPMTDFSPLVLKNADAGGGPPRPTSTPPPATPTPASTATPMLTPTPMPTPTVVIPPTDTPMPTSTPPPTVPAPGIPMSDAVRNQVPPAVVAEALAHPERIAGWGQPRDPGKPVSPANPLRECLSLVDPGKPYHPLFNGLIFKAGCP